MKVEFEGIKNNIKLIVLVLLYVALGILSLFYMLKLDIVDANLNGSFYKYIIFSVLLVIVFYLQIIIHEGGHLIFGLLSKYEFISFRIGSLTVVKEDGKLIRKKFNIPGTGGQCIMMPTMENYEDQPCVLYNLGSLILNGLVALIALAIYIFADANKYVDIIAIFFVLTGALIIITNGIPMKLGGLGNDGYNALATIKDKESKYCLYMQLKIAGLMHKGNLIKDLPKEWFELSENSDLNNPLKFAIKALEGNYYHYNYQFDKAREHAENLLNEDISIPLIFYSELTCDLLFYEIIGQRRTEKINKLYDKDLEKYIKLTSCYVHRKTLMYAYNLLFKKDLEKAKGVIKEFEKVKKTYPDKGAVMAEEELIKYVDTLYNSEIING